MKKQRKVIDVKIPEHRRRKPNLNTGICTFFGHEISSDPTRNILGNTTLVTRPCHIAKLSNNCKLNCLSNRLFAIVYA